MIDMTGVLTTLASKRPIFHSEADFQHALAWEIHERWPSRSIRLERRPPHLHGRIYLDIWAEDSDTILAIELKYKTRRLSVDVGDETFDLLDQAAQDVGRYDFLRDVERLEQIVSGRNDITGSAIFLTNDSAYWEPPRDEQTVDASFRIHQGRVVTGELRWGSSASAGTMRGREEPIVIRRVYSLDWRDYSEPTDLPYGRFRYLLVKVERDHGL